VPKVSIIIVNYNTKAYLCETLQSIYAHCPAGEHFPEVVVVDNASSDGSCEAVKQDFPQVVLIESDENLGFGLGNNLAVSHATAPYIMLLNSDAYLTTDTPSLLAAYLDENTDVSCVCPRVILPESGDLQPKTFGFVPTAKRVLMQSLGLNRVFPKSEYFQGVDGDYRWSEAMAVGWVSGVCMMMRKKDYLGVNGFDERFFMYCEDVELCMKLADYGKIILLDDGDVVHYGGASSKTVSAKVKNSVLQQRHLLMIVQDYFGSLQQTQARIAMLFGMLIRLLAAALLIPIKGIRDHAALRSAWARFKDLLVFKTSSQAAQ